MTKFLVLYRSSVSPDEQMANLTPEQAQAGMQLWMEWAGKAGDGVFDLGSPLSPVTTVGSKTESRPPTAGFSILQAETREAVTTLVEQHPHFHGPGDNSIEILEFLPMPGS